jgi:polyribonucleotide nucleotidyltransferase
MLGRRNVVHRVEREIAGRKFLIETGKVAEQAAGAVMARYGDTVVLATVCRSAEPLEGLDFFPLTVEYEEKMYAVGRIPGGFFRREGRPSESAILAARLTDRPLRPLFPKGYRHEVQVIVTVLSTDQENEPEIMSINAASAAVSISDIPFEGPVGAARVGLINGEFVLNPTATQLLSSDLDLVVAGTREAVIMIEAGAREVPEEVVLEAIKFGHQGLQAMIDLQEELVGLVARPKHPFAPPVVDTSVQDAVAQYLGPRLSQAVNNPVKQEREQATELLRQEVVAELTKGLDPEEALVRAKMINQAFDTILKEEVRKAILERGLRPDGRGPKDIRPIWIEVGVLPRTHGSAIFTRGQTQVISIATLGSKSEEQLLDSLGLEETKRYMHHYNFPPYSTGEVKRLRGPSRRDIGHGALAERALLPVIPPEEEFPYTIRVVSEVVSSNGSTSMASVCGSTLALMDAGVPIRAPVGGVAMGLVTSSDGKWVVLTDIQGIEDALGDMDFKVAGTQKGVTALQLDIKTKGIGFDIMAAGFEQAREGRMYILGRMMEAMPSPRASLSPYAPRIHRLKINPDRIGALIGPGGKTIRSITEATKTTIDVENDGTVLVYSPNEANALKAIQQIQALTREIEVGATYTGKVVRIMPYGAFVELAPGKDGLLHISELSDRRVERVEDVLSVGDEVTVMVTDIDKLTGKVSLSRKAVLTGQMPKPRAERPPRPPARPAPGGAPKRDKGR